MSTELKTECVRTGKTLKEMSCEQKIDMDITLPDYCADIKKILSCTLVPGIHTVSLSGERATARGTGTVRIIYTAEGDKTDVFEKNCEISASVQVKDATPENIVTACCAVDFLNCRAVSQRKISVSGSVSVIFICFGVVCESFAVKGDGDNIQAKKEKITCEEHLGFFEKTFDLSETVALNSEHPPVGKVLSCSCRCVNESIKLSSGKLLVKADAITDIYYIPEEKSDKLYFFSHSMPVSQILDLKDVPDGALCSLSLRPCQRLITVKADSSGSNRLVDIALRISAFVRAWEKKEVEVITDSYCTAFETEESYGFSQLMCPVREISEARQAKGTVEFSTPVKEICFSKCLEISKNIRYSQDKVDFDCSALIFIMYLDENGVPCTCEKNFDFDFSYSIVKKCKEPMGNFDIDPIGLSVKYDTKDKAEIVFDYKVCGRVYCSFEKKILKKLSLCNDKPKQVGAALTVYFAEKGESLWDIARSHSTSVELIKQENSLDTEFITEKVMLLIPCG